MTGREYLKNVWYTPIKIRTLEAEEKALRQDIMAISALDYSVPRVSGGKGTDMSDQVARLFEARRKIGVEWENWIQTRFEARKLIDQVTDQILQDLLKNRYLNRLQWEEIAVAMGYSYRRTTQLHGKALAAFEEVYRKRFPIISHGGCDIV